MCGRYNTATPAEDMRRQYEIEFSYHGFTWRLSWNVAPSRDVPIVTLEDGRRTLRHASWGLVPACIEPAES